MTDLTKGGTVIKATEFFHDILRHELVPGKNMCELTSYNGVAFWWFADKLFYNTVVKLSKGNSFKSSYYKKVIAMFYRSVGIYADAIFDSVLTVIILIFNFIAHNINKSKSDPKNNITIVMTTQDNKWGYLDGNSCVISRKSDVFFNSIIGKLKGQVKIVGTYPINTTNIFSSFKIFLEKIFFWDVNYCPYNMYWSIDVWKEEYLAYKHFSDIWDSIKFDTISDMCNKYDLPANYVLDELDFYFHVLFPLEAKYIALIRRMIKHECPDLFLVINEYGWRERPLIVAANVERIPTLAIQHGVIHPFHRGYIYNKYEISAEGQACSPYCPIPDMTTLYGEYHKDLLTKSSSYPPDHVVVTGQPRYDILPVLMKDMPLEAIASKYCLDSNSIYILWTTQCHGLSMEENICNFNTVFSAIEGLENVNLVIKQHPGEGDEYTDLIKEYLKDYSIKVKICPRDSNTFELLCACDLVITKSSTTGLEGIALNKPLIILNLSEDPDTVDYVDQGVAIGVYDASDLKRAITQLLNDDSMLAQNRKKFIKRNLYSVDGQATERVIRCAMSMIEKKIHADG
ncbi:hypothetical protein E2N92_10500 [Methanofollis formosanus]|uniref:UDP-N-acetylglucosamine 2-epimerase domain-containing protein n=1 Tax=Methanofollis formosanus TaxID=299308 RepID=A0A8G1A3D5_9EURY|nr:UDP-N-acetylglucosamine 2-epimerase [Methanofollis formosanus]QYZ79825.1 hypothetical protein E2N92_10500 [Methanofollis formosanus]